MFKTRIPLQTPILIKLSLFAALVTFFTGWSVSTEASIKESHLETKTVAMSQSGQKLSNLAQLTHQQVNEYRVASDLAPLEFSALVSEQATIHSIEMAQNIVEFSHDGFEGRVQALKDNVSIGSVAENVAYNAGYQDPVSTAVAGWIKSDGHRKNMEGNYNLTGIGVAVNPTGEHYFTQIFILEN